MFHHAGKRDALKLCTADEKCRIWGSAEMLSLDIASSKQARSRLLLLLSHLLHCSFAALLPRVHCNNDFMVASVALWKQCGPCCSAALLFISFAGLL